MALADAAPAQEQPMVSLFASRRNRLLASLLLAPVLLSILPVPAIAAEASFVVTLRVRAECFVQTNGAIMVANGGASSGSVVEACNVPGGYTVTANYRSLANDESAVLEYNGQVIQLPASGQAVLRTSDMATIKSIAYQLTSTHLDSPLAISLSIQAD
jgi:hypothetical protein